MMESLVSLTEVAAASDNPEHALCNTLGVQHLMIDAPAGCGKTQVLAERAEALIRGKGLRPPRRILALTFSNRAKDNLRQRLRSVMGVRYWERVTVTNFHGFAHRVILAHGSVIGLDAASATMPQRGWLKDLRGGVGIDWTTAQAVDNELRSAKSGPRTDEEVLADLENGGNHLAVAYQRKLMEERRLDYDDLLRYADLILAEQQVCFLYANHYPVVMVDELQDLTQQQLRLALLTCGAGLTVAGDRAQGIYSFAGAEPPAVYATIAALSPAIVEFRLSYRSSPRVLAAVNALARIQGTTELECADPERWPDDGHVLTLVRENSVDEAEAVTQWISSVLPTNTDVSIGVIARNSQRAAELLRATTAAGFDPENWSDATHDVRVVKLLRRHARQAEAEAGSVADQIDALSELCRIDIAPDDIDRLDDLADAIATFRGWSSEGQTLAACLERCRAAPLREAPVSPGVHILNAHRGKGQQFDWVVAVGLEEENLPDFRATTSEEISEELRVLHVMISRARLGLVVTRVEEETNQYGRVFPKKPSRWWDPLAAEATGDI